VRKFPEAQPCHGVEEIARVLAGFKGPYAHFQVDLLDVFEVGDDRVLAHAHIRAEGRGSGVNIAGDLYTCLWLRHGRFFRSEDHLTPPGALRALGREGETLDVLKSSQA
jgi:hypothetical protein